MWIPVRTSSFIRQVMHSKFKRSDDGLHGLDMRTSYMEIACIRFTVQMADFMVQMRQALIWKLRPAKVRPSRRQGNTIRMRLNSGKNLESRTHSCPSRSLMSTVWTVRRYVKSDAHLNLQPINRGP
jgi:hypothetical protein